MRNALHPGIRVSQGSCRMREGHQVSQTTCDEINLHRNTVREESSDVIQRIIDDKSNNTFPNIGITVVCQLTEVKKLRMIRRQTSRSRYPEKLGSCRDDPGLCKQLRSLATRFRIRACDPVSPRRSNSGKFHHYGINGAETEVAPVTRRWLVPSWSSTDMEHTHGGSRCYRSCRSVAVALGKSGTSGAGAARAARRDTR